MIRLPTSKERAKITTPNEATTSLGVSPISSGRNVMVKVKDTLSFIEAARAVHGDRYDYSQTEYLGSQVEVWIVCKIHGKFRLSKAGSHYRNGRRPCGCRRCGDDSRMVVKQCKCGKVVAGSKDWNYQKKCCKPCSKHVHKTTNCKNCGKSFLKVNGKSFCSLKCRKAKNANSPWFKTLRTFTCVSCGKEHTREVRNNVKHLLCNRECHMKWKNRSVNNKNWILASRKAKKRWMKQRRTERKATSNKWNWFRLSRRKSAEIAWESNSSGWTVKCNTAAKTLGDRLTFAKNGKRRMSFESWQSLCQEGLASGGYSTMDQWGKKCYSTYKNMKWKRRLRNARKHISIRTEDVEQRPVQLSIWELLEIQQQTN